MYDALNCSLNCLNGNRDIFAEFLFISGGNRCAPRAFCKISIRLFFPLLAVSKSI